MLPGVWGGVIVMKPSKYWAAIGLAHGPYRRMRKFPRYLRRYRDGEYVYQDATYTAETYYRWFWEKQP
jgi:hypothetical protein